MKLALIIVAALLFPTGLVVTAAGVPLFGYEQAETLDEQPGTGSRKRHVLGHVERVYPAAEALKEIELPSQAKQLIEQVTEGAEVIKLRECKGIYIYTRNSGVEKGDKVAVSGFVYAVSGQGLVVGSSLLGSLLSGGLPKPSAVQKVPLWYFWLGIGLAVLSLVLGVVGIRMKKPERPAVAPAAGAPGGPPPGAYPPGGYPPGGHPPGGHPPGGHPPGGYPPGGYPPGGPPPGGYPPAGSGPGGAPAPGAGYGYGYGYGQGPGGPAGNMPAAYDPAAANLPKCDQCGHPMGWAPQGQRWICPNCGHSRNPG